jgi:hypothetical protein
VSLRSVVGYAFFCYVALKDKFGKGLVMTAPEEPLACNLPNEKAETTFLKPQYFGLLFPKEDTQDTRRTTHASIT